jgi:hypothetical protein
MSLNLAPALAPSRNSEANIEQAIGRRLLKPEDRTKPWPGIHACYAAWLSDKAMQWLVLNGVVNANERGDTAATFARAIW